MNQKHNIAGDVHTKIFIVEQTLIQIFQDSYFPICTTNAEVVLAVYAHRNWNGMWFARNG